jgi:5'-3' exonuclease
MGIPFYYKTLIDRYPYIKSNTKPTVDIFCIDYNGLIHPVANQTPNMEYFHYNLWNKTEQLIQNIRPTQYSYIFVDGVAPLAKIHQQRKRRYLKTISNTPTTFDTNSITCGTPFMNDLMEFLTNTISNTPNIHISTSHENGEGEHKMIQYLYDISINENINVIIHGLDADLILLSLMNSNENLHIHLMRENKDTIEYISIDKLKHIIIDEWKTIFPKNTLHNYCYILSILGNDFIPHPIGINMKNNGIEQLKKASKNLNPISNKNDLHTIFKNITDDTQIDKKQYYKDIVMIHDVSSACKLFLDGIEWTYRYYNKEISKIDHGWYYPYNGAPLIRDIANHSLLYEYTPLNTLENFIHNDLQLLIVLPIQSIDILPTHLQNKMKENKWMYPRKFKLITFMKQHEWEYVPVLPTIDIHSIITS